MKEQESAFIGKITAGATHEFVNVLATIRETSGLMEDLLALNREVSFAHKEKFKKILNTIQKHVDRGMVISEKLNAFAHSMDEPKSRVVINELLDQLVFLMQRFSRLSNVQLTRDRANQIESSPVILSDPFKLQLSIASCIEYCLANTSPGGVITLQTRYAGKGIAIRCVVEKGLCPRERTDDFSDEFNGLQETFDDLDAHLLQINSPEQQGLELIIPL